MPAGSNPTSHRRWLDGRWWHAGPSAGFAGTTVRVLFGIIFGIDAALKWLPGYRVTCLSQLKSVARGQPAWLHGWFQFWMGVAGLPVSGMGAPAGRWRASVLEYGPPRTPNQES